MWRTQRQIEVPSTFELKEKLHELRESSGRSIDDMMVYFLYKTSRQLSWHELLIEPFIEYGHWKDHILYLRIPITIYNKLRDIAWENALRHQGKWCGAGYIMGACANFQIKTKTDWNTFFSLGLDMIDRVEEAIVNRYEELRIRHE